ncbi:hypothetical protein M9H77_29473 [Catharanthus roseus]|uniref:Uncharacterized protein n=1 Tax=Catharanthus roseus TaxID=4058 RepID=A0ACB9ZUV6_CATRO|nr:hypothetical protein M9H77_29473 [Catharanthus roseus]
MDITKTTVQRKQPERRVCIHAHIHANTQTSKFTELWDFACPDRICSPLTDAPECLNKLLDYEGDRRLKKFKDNIRAYNSIFEFSSVGDSIDKNINRGSGSYVLALRALLHMFLYYD